MCFSHSNKRGIMVTVCAFFSWSIIYGLFNCFGVWYMHLLDIYRGSAYETSLVSSFQVAGLYVPGIFTSVICTTIGLNKAVVLGSLTASIGYFASAFTDSIYMLYLTQGAISGFGFGLMSLPWVSIVSSYFDNPRQRDGAVCFVTAGAGVGMVIWPPLIETFIGIYGLKGSFIIAAGLCLQVSIFGQLSPVKHIKVKEDTFIIKDTKFTSRSEKSTFVRSLRKSFSMLADWHFSIMLLGELLWVAAQSISMMIIPEFARRNGHPDSLVGLLISVNGAANTISRVVMTVLSNVSSKCNNGKLRIMTATAFCSGVSMVLFPVSGKSFPCLMLLSLCFGTCVGLKAGNIRGFLLNLFGIKDVTLSLGNLSIAFGIGYGIGPPLGGFIFDLTRSYNSAFYLACALAFVSALLYGPMLKSYENRLKNVEENIELGK